MKCVNRTVGLHDIEVSDESYRYSDERFDERSLRASIQADGVLNPVILIERDQSYQVVTGFRRLKTAQQLDLAETPAKTVSDQVPAADLFELSVLENQATRSLNWCEKAILVAKLRAAKVDESLITGMFMPLVGLAGSKDRVNELMIAEELPNELLDYFLAKGISFHRLQHLRGLSKVCMTFFADLVRILAPSVSVFQQISKALVEAAKRDEIGLDEIIADGPAQVLAKQAIAEAERLKQLRQITCSLRYPVLAAKNRELRSLVDSLEADSNIRITWDRHLEEPGLTIRLKVVDSQDIDASIELLRRLQANVVLSHLSGRI